MLNGLFKKANNDGPPKEASARRGIGLAVLGVILVAGLALAFYWSREPAQRDVKELASAHSGGNPDLIPGQVTTSMLIAVASTLLDKPGGYLSNDKTPPSVLLDNLSNWEWGVLIEVRDLARILRNDMSRTQTQSSEDPDLSIADPQFHFDSESWLLPSTEGEYGTAIQALERYMNRLVKGKAQFSPRADNLREWLQLVSKRLGNISHRLSASVPKAEARLLGIEAGSVGDESEPKPQQQFEQTPWLQVDDVFFEARGTTWALLHFLRAIAIDFESVLNNKNAHMSFIQVINKLEATQQPIWSPMILRGRGFGMWANHSLAMASYISRANAAIIDLVNLLAQG